MITIYGAIMSETLNSLELHGDVFSTDRTLPWEDRNVAFVIVCLHLPNI